MFRGCFLCWQVRVSVSLVSLFHFWIARSTSSPSMTSSSRRIRPSQSVVLPAHLAFGISHHRAYSPRGFSCFAVIIRSPPFHPLIIRIGTQSFFIRIRISRAAFSRFLQYRYLLSALLCRFRGSCRLLIRWRIHLLSHERSFDLDIPVDPNRTCGRASPSLFRSLDLLTMIN